MSKIIGVAEVKKHFSEVMNEVNRDGEHFIIERKGRPMTAMVSIKDLEIIERYRKKEGKKGLLVALGAWDDFKGLDEVIEHIYKKRETAKERKVKRLS